VLQSISANRTIFMARMICHNPHFPGFGENYLAMFTCGLPGN
jgi:hypothetical protein